MAYMIGIHKKDFEKVTDHLSAEDKAEPIIVDLCNQRVIYNFWYIKNIIGATIQKLGDGAGR